MTIATTHRRGASEGSRTPSSNPASPQDHQAFLLGDYVRDRIDFRVERLGILFELGEEDKEDLRQRMYLELWRAWRRFNPEASCRETFATRVLDCLFKYLLRGNLNRQQRECDSPLAFDDVTDGFEPVVNEVRGGARDEQALRELRLDIEAVIDGMPERLQRVCRTLMVYSGREAARRLGIGKSSLYRARASIRKRFEAAGIRGFLDEAGTDSPRLQM